MTSDDHPFLERIGTISIRWNDVDLLWYLYATCIMHETPRAQIDAIFRFLNTGSSQRKFTLTMARSVMDEGSPVLKFISECYASSNEVAGLRNAIVHGNYNVIPIIGVKFHLAPGGAFSKANALSGRDAALLQTLDDVIAKIEAVISQASAMRLMLMQEFLPSGKRVLPPLPLSELKQQGFPAPQEE